MRHFLLVLVTWWILGIVLGVLNASDVVFVTAIAVTFVLLLRSKFHVQIGIAAICLLFLGYVWGGVNIEKKPTCTELENVVTGEITQIVRLEQSNAQYKVISSASPCVYLVTSSRFPRYSVGDVIEVEGDIQAISHIPKEYEGYAKYLERMGFHATIRYPTITIKSQSTSIQTKEYISERINTLFPEPEASILQAMLLARVGSIPESIEEQFKHTNVSHILAISGSNISLLAGLLIGLLLLVPISPIIRVITTIAALWIYIGMIDYQVSAVRAALFWTVGIMGTQMHVLLSVPTIFILTLVFMVSFNPAIIVDIGFQLSFAAVAGISAALFISKKEEFIQRRKTFTLLLLSSVGAMLTTWPLIAHYFGTVSLIGLPANMVIVPLTSLFVLSALSSLILSYIFFPVGLLGASLTHGIWVLMDISTQMFSGIPNMYIENIALSVWVTVSYYVFVIGFAIWMIKRSNRSWREVWQ